MVRALPSAVPPKMYRHFALVTLLLTTCVAMFAEGENREALAAQVEEHHEPDTLQQESAAKVPKASIARRTPQHHRFGQEIDGFDVVFGAPMERALGSLGSYTTAVASEVAQAGYSDAYLASLGPQERDLLLKGLAKEGLLSAEQRERTSASLIAASQVRSGGLAAND